MLALVVDHLWQSTVVAAGAALLAFALRNRGAHVRYWIWFAASMKFLIPFAALVALGAQFPVRSIAVPGHEDAEWRAVAERWMQPMAARDSDAQARAVRGRGFLALGDTVGAQAPASVGPVLEGAAATSLVQPAADAPRVVPQSHAVTPEVLAATPASGERVAVGAVALAIWLLGAVVLATAWLRRWVKLVALRCSARPLTGGLFERRGVEIRMTSSLFEPGVVGVWRPVLLLPEGIVERLTSPQLDAILRHEQLHVERRDNLTALLHMLVQLVFWFYPVVWWLGRRLIEERERACDEAVLAAGADPKTYASGIVAVCDFCLESPLRCAAGVGGGSLEERVRRIRAYRPIRMLGRWTRGLLVAAPAAVLGLPVVTGVVTTSATAQEPARAEPTVSQPRDVSPMAGDGRRLRESEYGLPWFGTGGGRDSDGYYFNLSLSECVVPAPPRGTTVTGVGVLPAIGTYADLIRYAYGLSEDELVPTTGTSVRIRVREAQFIGFDLMVQTPPPVVRHDECRAVIRDALVAGHGLEMHREAERWVVDRIEIPPFGPLRQRLDAGRMQPAAQPPRRGGRCCGPRFLRRHLLRGHGGAA